jgi:hypothetical protein
MCKKIHGEIGHDFHEFFLKDEQRENIKIKTCIAKI